MKLLSNMHEINFKKLHVDAITPTQGYKSDAAFDLYTYQTVYIHVNEVKLINIGIAIELPSFLCAIIRARSSQHTKGIFVYPGLIDPDYRGDIGPVIYNFSRTSVRYVPGDRVGQLQFMYVPKISLKEVSKINVTDRNTNRCGSTGR